MTSYDVLYVLTCLMLVKLQKRVCFALGAVLEQRKHSNL
jgi:hypothetical protein